MKVINFGTLNLRGCRGIYEMETLFKDVSRYDLQILGFTESHIIGDEKVEDIKIKIKNETRKYKYFEGGIKGDNVFSGVGCIIDASLKPTFQRITDRICLPEAYTNNAHKIIIITAYTPTFKCFRSKT